MSRDRFEELMSEAVITLPHNLKNVLRIVEDPEVDDESRTMLAGALLHVLSQSVAIPGVRGTLQHVGSALVIGLALEKAMEKSPEPFEKHSETMPELFGDLEEQLEVARAFLGEGMKLLDEVAAKLHEQDFRGHAAPQCIADTESSNWLYEAVHEALIETVEIDDDDVTREIKDSPRIKKNLQARVGR